MDKAKKRKSLLLVEPDQTIGNAVTVCLEDAGYSVSTVASAAEAVDALIWVPNPCLVLIDFVTLGVEAAELCNTLSGHHAFAALPLHVSSSVKRTLRTDLLRAIVDDYCGARRSARAA